MILTVTPNPALDITYKVASVTLGSSHRVDTETVRGGGKGVNVCSVLTSLNESALAIFPCGGGIGETLLEDLAFRGVRTVPVKIAGETRRTLTIAETDGTTTNFSEPGPRLTPEEWELLTQKVVTHSRDAQAVVISGSLPPATSPENLSDLVHRVAQTGALTVVDTSGPNLAVAARAGAHLLAPNTHELEECFPGNGTLEASRRLIEAGCDAVLISLGAQGLTFVSGSEVMSQPAAPGVHGNTTGAGDAALAAFIGAHIRGEPLQDCLRRASAAGASAVLEPVAGLISAANFSRLLAQLKAPDRLGDHT